MILKTVNEVFELKEVKPNEYSPLSLAFIGDSVFDVVIKSVLVEKGNCQVNIHLALLLLTQILHLQF